jgi:hypothetical protein
MLREWLAARGEAGVDQPGLDERLPIYLQTLYFSGESPSRGEKLMAGLMYCHPEFSRFGGSRLPRSWKALRGWRRLCPGRSRAPEPRCFWAAVACHLAGRGLGQMGIFVLMAVSTYLRPGEMLSLKRGSVLPPAAGITRSYAVLVHPMEDGTRSKTGERDVSIMLDSKWLKWLDPALETLRAGDPELALWDFDYHLFTREFKKSVTALQSPHVVPYQMRHSGASCDRASRERSQEEVIKRG